MVAMDNTPIAGPKWATLPSHREWLADERDRLLEFAAKSVHPDGGFAWLDDNGHTLGGEAVAQWKAVVGSILQELPDVMRELDGVRAAVTKSRAFEAKAHAACEVTVKRLVEGLRVAFWNDPNVLAALKLSSGGRLRRTTQQPVPPVAAGGYAGGDAGTTVTVPVAH